MSIIFNNLDEFYILSNSLLGLGDNEKLAGCVSRGLHGDIMIMIYDETSVHKKIIFYL